MIALDGYIGAQWGSMGNIDLCPFGTYATRARIKFESPQESGDDSALNGIELECGSLPLDKNKLDKSHSVTSSVGEHGEWKEWQNCSNGQLIVGARLRAEKHQGSGKISESRKLILISSKTINKPGQP